ncbi:hypothetical protein N1031_19610 [Herbiconiux moechotypicola]|uniref:TadE family type IV pilus minor pilin n=1 Tax=Herbiconiux moechotypicola TaxID=637393 RepID=UPI00217F142F|nr:TadE family type IV pilus minor pilin [Herbiconiux moechotypicola]MCS5731969.1 hypothetical protein [Herbiconiux moechotypicola]
MTAEFAMMLPAVAVLLALGAVGAQLGATQVMLTDATADAARLAARGEPHAAQDRLSGAVPGASLEIQHRGGLVCVATRVRAGASGLGSLVELTATGCALDDSRPPDG